MNSVLVHEESDPTSLNQFPERLADEVRQLVATLVGKLGTAARGEPPTANEVQIDHPELQQVFVSIVERLGTLRRQADLSRMTADRRAHAFLEWMLRPDSELPNDVRLHLQEAMGPAASPSRSQSADPVEARLHRTLVGTMQTVVENIPDDVLGMDRLRFHLRWIDTPRRGSTPNSACRPHTQRIPSAASCG